MQHMCITTHWRSGVRGVVRVAVGWGLRSSASPLSHATVASSVASEESGEDVLR
jgi:hypothetical protein